MKIVAISDTHGRHSELNLPDGDILVHAGDICAGRGSLNEIAAFNKWLGTLSYSHIICIAGNHDFPMVHYYDKAHELMSNCNYLKDEETVINGVKFYGSPWQPFFYDWAFNLQRGEEIAAKWAMIPDDVDVLITHGPPKGYGDETLHDGTVGCYDLLDRINQIKVPVHISGHIHYGYGVRNNNDTVFVNASSCGENNQPDNAPIIIELDDQTKKVINTF